MKYSYYNSKEILAHFFHCPTDRGKLLRQAENAYIIMEKTKAFACD